MFTSLIKPLKPENRYEDGEPKALLSKMIPTDFHPMEFLTKI